MPSTSMKRSPLLAELPGQPPLSRNVKAAAVTLILVGFALLLYKFPSVPAGLHQDELSEAYESFSLLHTGADRWGSHLPVYFLDWGSGQNVLEAYLTVPVIALLGLTRLSARLIPMLCGLLTLPLFFVTMRRWFGPIVAVIGLFFLVFSPWHIVISRWGIENNMLPFIILLGIYTYGKALDSRSAWWILPSLIPFALALYTYGITITIVPELLFFLFMLGRSLIRETPGKWSGALAIFLILSLPIFFFCLKNYVTKKNYAFEQHLPFSVQLLPFTRVDQIKLENPKRPYLIHNLGFIARGLDDDNPWYQVPGVSPVTLVVKLLALVGLVGLLRRAFRERRFGDPFLLWFLCCIPMFLLVPLHISRAIAIYLPIIAMAAVGSGELYANARIKLYRVPLAVVCSIMFVYPLVRFLHAYYGATYAAEINDSFYPDLPATLTDVQQLAGTSMPIFITDRILLNYVDVLYFTRTDPFYFQHSGATWDHPDFGRYRFSRQTAEATPRPIAFLVKADEPAPCAAPVETQKAGQFNIGVCR